MDFFGLQLLHLVSYIVVCWFVICVTWYRMLFIMLSMSTGLGHRKFNRLRNRQTKRNRMLLILCVDWCCIHISPKIRAECAWQVSYTGCLCNFDVVYVQNNVAATCVTICFHSPHEYFSKIAKRPPDRILR